MSRRRRLLLAATGLLGLSAAAAGLALRAALWLPPAVSPIELGCSEDLPELPRGRPIRLLVWNIQFAAGPGEPFFYDGGPRIHVDADTVADTLEAIAETVVRHQPDIVLLQEVDRRSRRTARIDQHAALAAKLGLGCEASTPYWRSRYVPHPEGAPLGRMDMHLSVFSRYRIDRATRHQLALLDESWLRQQFNLRRALMELSFPVVGGGELRLFNTHLSAFSFNDGTLERQVAQLDAHVSDAERLGVGWLLAGDLNALPPDDDPQRLAAEAPKYGPKTLEPLFEHWSTPVSPALYRNEPAAWYTYRPSGDRPPDRTLDYVFHGSAVDLLAYSVLTDATASDHLPLLVEFQVRSK